MKLALFCTSSIKIYKKQQKHVTNIRNTQYINGTKSVLQYLLPFIKKEDHHLDIIYCDNTITTLPDFIESLLPSNTTKLCYKNNDYGKVNKSAGLID